MLGDSQAWSNNELMHREFSSLYKAFCEVNDNDDGDWVESQNIMQFFAY
jgi:hypothetical protein